MGFMGGGKGGGSKALASKPNILSALRIQTSSYGQVIPVVYGENRIAGRLIWAGDFTAIPHTSTTKVGGKGLGSGGGNAISNTTYTYQTAVAMALCMGPIVGLGNVWDTKGRLTMISAQVPFTVPGGGGSTTVTPPGSGIVHAIRGVGRTDAYSVSHTDYGSDGSVTLSGNQQTPMTLVASSPGAGQYTQSGTTLTFTAADSGKVMIINYVYSVPDSNSNGQPLQKLSLTLFTGTKPQSPWSYLTSAHPGQDDNYAGIAYIAASAMDLGESGTLPNLSFEIVGLLPFGAGIMDAEPSAIITDMLANALYGRAGLVAPGDLTQYRNFCTANGLFISPVFDSQRPMAQSIQDILDITNAAPVWSEGVLKIIPYGDTLAVGNGATFTPNTQPIYDLTTADLLTLPTVKRPSAAEVMNTISIEWCNRANDYNPDVAEDKDDALIAQFGVQKASPIQAHGITTTSVAKFAANLMRKRSCEIRATYNFTLGWQFNLLEPMDLVTLTIPELGYNLKPIRVTGMREDASGAIQIDAEDFPWGTAVPTLYPHQVGTGFVAQANADPGTISAPVIFEANDRLSLTGNYEVWLGTSGPTVAITAATNATPIQITAANHGYKSGQKVTVAGVGGNTAANGNWVATFVDPDNFTLNNSIGNSAYTSGGVAVNGDWGGASVWLSPDNSSYVKIGTMYGPSRIGTLTAQLLTNTDPDTTHTLAVDITRSLGVLNSGTTADADNFRTLCYVDGELVSFQTATLTAAYRYNLATRLRRGVFGSPITTHAAASSFLRLDDGVFVWEADPTLVGTTIYFKFTSFNRMGLMEQSLANATAYSFAFNGTFGNHDETPANNATIDSTFVSGTNDNIRIYGPGGTSADYTAWKMKDQGGTRTIPHQTITTVEETGASPQVSTIYWISYDFQAVSHRAWRNYNNYVQAIYRGQMRVGSLTTVNSSGTGGTTGGLGDSGASGSGAGGRPLPGM